MTQYISRVTLEVNGEKITDFAAVTEGKRELRQLVKLMGKTGYIKVTPRYEVALDYVVPISGAFNFSGIYDGRITIIDEAGGGRITYTGCCTLEIGEAKMEDGKEKIQTITFGAETRREE